MLIRFEAPMGAQAMATALLVLLSIGTGLWLLGAQPVTAQPLILDGREVHPATEASAAVAPLRGPWIELNDVDIDRARRREVRVVVLNAAGEPVADAEVRTHQLRHALKIGVLLPPENPVGGVPEVGCDRPVWRLFNSVSLERLVNWRDLAPTDRGGWRSEPFDQIDAALDAAETTGLHVRGGQAIAGDWSRNPDWTARLDAASRQLAAVGHVSALMRRLGTRADTWDLYGGRIDHDALYRQSGDQALRDLYHAARSRRPEARLGVRFNDALDGRRRTIMQGWVTSMQLAFVSVDVVALEQRYTGHVLSGPTLRTFEALSGLNLDIDLAQLEVGGANAAAAANNLEIVLRAVMAQPRITGVWFTGVLPAHCFDPAAAFIDEEGNITPAGAVLERLFNETWSDRREGRTSGNGSLTIRLMAGEHVITAQTAPGVYTTARIWVDPDLETQVVVIQPTAPGDPEPLALRVGGASFSDVNPEAAEIAPDRRR